MVQKFFSISLAIASLMGFTPLVKAQTMESPINQVVNHLVGIMDTSAQAEENPQSPDVRMTTCVIQLLGVENQIDSTYLYQEQALSDKLKEPYRQRFLEIRFVEEEDKVESIAFKPLQSSKWINFCDRPQNQRNINLDDVGEVVCSVSLRQLMTIYIGETPPEGCATNVQGAVTITNTVILHSQGMDTWDRGFDEEGNQVWGAENEGYQFRWYREIP
jgi:hypothetical protein